MFFKCKIKIIFLVVSNIKKRLSMTDIQILARVKPHFKKSEGESCINTYDKSSENIHLYNQTNYIATKTQDDECYH